MAKGDVHISLPFVATVILALFLFIPACMVASKLFIRTGQAADSFADLVKDLEDLSGTRGDATKTRVLIMDAETFVVAFKEGSERAIVDNPIERGQIETDQANPDPDSIGMNIDSDLDYIFKYPQDRCQNTKTCLCLCQKYELGERNVRSQTTATEIVQRGEITYLCTQLACENLDIQLANNFGVTRASEDEPRRVELKLEKVSDQITITKQ